MSAEGRRPGNNSRCTSSTLLFPLLWLPSTQICGKSIWDAEEPTAVKTSCSLLTTDTISEPSVFVAIVTRSNQDVEDVERKKGKDQVEGATRVRLLDCAALGGEPN